MPPGRLSGGSNVGCAKRVLGTTRFSPFGSPVASQKAKNRILYRQTSPIKLFVLRHKAGRAQCSQVILFPNLFLKWSTMRISSRVDSLWLITILMFLMLGGVASGEDIRLLDAVKRFADSREAIESYELTMKVTVRGRALPQKLTNGAVFHPGQKQLAYQIEIAYDDVGKRRLVAHRETHKVIGTDQIDRQPWKLYVNTPKWTLRSTGSSLFKHPAEPLGRFKVGFDPLAVGIAFAGDISRGERWQKIVEHYQDWNDASLTKLPNGILEYGDSNIADSDIIRFDTDKGHMVVRLRHRNAGTDMYLVTIVPKLMSGHWVPDIATINEKDKVHFIKFDWHSINEPVDHRFDPEKILQKFEKSALRSVSD